MIYPLWVFVKKEFRCGERGRIVGEGLVPFRLSGRRSAGGAYPKGHLAPPLRWTGGCIVGVGALDDPFIGQKRKFGKRAIRESPLRGDAGLHRRGGYHPPVCRTWAQVCGRLIAAPTERHTFPRRDDHWSSVDPHPRPTNGASRAPPPTEDGRYSGRLIAAPTKKRETGKLALPRLLNHNAKNQTNEFRIPVS